MGSCFVNRKGVLNNFCEVLGLRRVVFKDYKIWRDVFAIEIEEKGTIVLKPVLAGIESNVGFTV